MANAWPPTPGTGYLAHGITTIVWGTAGIYVPAFTGISGTTEYIVKKAKFMRRNEFIDIENGTGIEAAVISILKGEQIELTVVEDSSVTNPPQTNDIVVFSTPFHPVALNFLVVDASVEGSRKAENERVLVLKSYTGIPNITATT